MAVFPPKMTFLPLVAAPVPGDSGDMNFFAPHTAVRPGRPRRLARSLVDAVHEMNAAQQALFENNLRLDRYLLDPPDSGYLHWEPGASGWRLRGSYLPADAGDREARRE